MKLVLPRYRLALCLLIALGATAGADEKDDIAQAKHHFEAGSLAFDQGRFDAACDEFRQAYQLSHRADLLYNIGQASMRQGDAARAIEAFDAYLAGKPDAQDRVAIEATVVNLKPQTGHVRVVGAAVGSLIEVNGWVAGSAPLAAPVLVTIGKRRILEKSSDGTTLRATEVVVLPEQEVTADLVAIAPPPPPPPPPPPARLNRLGLGVGAAGIVVAATGFVILGLVPGAVSDAKNATTEEEFARLQTRADNLHNAGLAVLVIGAVAIAAGVAIVIVDRRSSSTKSVWLSPTVGGFYAEGRF